MGQRFEKGHTDTVAAMGMAGRVKRSDYVFYSAKTLSI
jgi:hypothetical protein